MKNIIIKILSIELIQNDIGISYNTSFIKYQELKEDNIIYNNDGSFKAVNVKENIFVNVSNKDLNKEATKKIKEYIGNYFIIAQNGQKINIDKKLVEEYIYSKYTFSLNRRLKLIKFILIHYFSEIIFNAYDKNWKANFKPKHNKDAKYGFYKYKIDFVLNLNNNIEHYMAIVLIRNAINKKKYLYDIIDIKKID